MAPNFFKYLITSKLDVIKGSLLCLNISNPDLKETSGIKITPYKCLESI